MTAKSAGIVDCIILSGKRGRVRRALPRNVYTLGKIGHYAGMSETIEWQVGYTDENRVVHCAQDGAQTFFGLTSAEKLAKKLGGVWEVMHCDTRLSPSNHKRYLAREANPEQSQAWGAMKWAE